MDPENVAPRIISHGWGEVRVEGQDRTFKDAKLWPGGARAWDWDETGTRHRPGVQPADVRELLDHGVETVVLSKGVYGRLQVPDETREFLEERGVDVEILKTDEAVQRYNELRESRAAGALIHSTC